LAAGFSNDDISVLIADNKGTKDFAHDKGTKAPEGTAAGVTTGGVRAAFILRELRELHMDS